MLEAVGYALPDLSIGFALISIARTSSPATLPCLIGRSMPRVPHVSRLSRCPSPGSNDVGHVPSVDTRANRADQREVDFIQKWIFPGGFLPSVSFVAEAVQKGGHNRLIIESVSNIGVSASSLSP